MTEREKPDLSKIEPLAPPADVDEAASRSVNPVDPSTANLESTPTAVVGDADAGTDRPNAEPRTSPETEEQQDRLRRS